MIRNFKSNIDIVIESNMLVSKEIDTSYFRNITHKPLTEKIIGKSLDKELCKVASVSKVGI